LDPTCCWLHDRVFPAEGISLALAFRPKPELDQATDGFGAAGQIVLLAAPVVEFLPHGGLDSDTDQIAGDRSPLLWCFRDNMS
jgi:hypothetical protein